MPVLDRKGSRRSRPIEKLPPTPSEVSSRRWEIIIYVPNIQRLNHIRQFILANREWAFVYCRRYPITTHYYLNGSIIFHYPHTANWLRASLGNGGYELPHEDPNQYRNHHMNSIQHYHEIGLALMTLVDDGEY
jgi:hypothetical protein